MAALKDRPQSHSNDAFARHIWSSPYYGLLKLHYSAGKTRLLGPISVWAGGSVAMTTCEIA